VTLTRNRTFEDPYGWRWNCVGCKRDNIGIHGGVAWFMSRKDAQNDLRRHRRVVHGDGKD
jgi:hypothetical protein